jgi:adenine-specific DNA glycosylase
MGRKHHAKTPGKTPAETVRKLMKAGKVKKKCCRSKPRCRRCPVLALRAAKAELKKAS